jgi:hypothetical protein
MKYIIEHNATSINTEFIISQVWFSAAAGIITSDRRIIHAKHIH